MSVNKEIRGDSLKEYRKKRSRSTTPEPFEDDEFVYRKGIFVVQKHAARTTHFDLRLELGRSLVSWAIPKGLSLDPGEKRLAIRTEDHPLTYSDFEGIIPEGNYGAGAMIIWDRGRWNPVAEPQSGLEKGKLLFTLHGYKLSGLWTLVRTKRGRHEWLLIKKPDEFARSESDYTFDEESIFSGLTVEELSDDIDREKEIETQLISLAPPFSEQEISPMLAGTSESPFSREGWIFELKYDGFRLLASRREEHVRLRYRSGKDATRFFPEITRALFALPFGCFDLDGEVVVLDAEGHPEFQRLQKRAQSENATETQIGSLENPVTFFVFDLLTFKNLDVRLLPLKDRKDYLRRIVPKKGPVRFADHFEVRGEALFKEIEKLGLEGIVAKKADSMYSSGRSRNWLKIHAHSQACFVIVGFTEPKGSRAGFGALHVAAVRGRNLTYVGRVGTGFSQQQLEQLRGQLDDLSRSEPPCGGPLPEGPSHYWVNPELVCEIRFKETTEQGMLRQPSFLGLRADIAPGDCLFPEKSSPDRGSRCKEVALTNLEKVFWPEDDFTKGDLIDYYRKVSAWLLPYLEDRPLVLDRYPDGIEGKSFFQKNPPDFIPSWIRTERIRDRVSSIEKSYLIIDDVETLTYVANLAAIPLHLWASRVSTLTHPDWCILDLDPSGPDFGLVIRIAQEIRSLCGRAGLDSFAKTSGGKGLHVLIPLGSGYTFEQAKLLAELLARVVVEQLSGIATLDRRIEKRGGKVYIDYLQNGRGKLLVAPYSVRPLPGAPVSTPLTWNEVQMGIDPLDFTIETLPSRLTKLEEDPLKAILARRADLVRALIYLENEIEEAE